ncbi:TPA: ead/Ea22-like family protein [Salmonella enterica subsp. enterica serovar Zanzibar]
MTIDKQALREAAEKAIKGPYVVGHHNINQHGNLSGVYVCQQWKDSAGGVVAECHVNCLTKTSEQVYANAEFIAVANPRTMLALLDENIQLQREKDAIEAVALALRDDMRQAREQLEAAERSIAELERSETQLINERDAAESALADMYQAATGERPEWSNMFGFADAVDVVEERLATLEANQSQTTPTGVQLITEAIGAHGYIVGCLLQGRPDLALEESRKWVSAFGQAAEIVSAQDAAGIGKGD